MIVINDKDLPITVAEKIILAIIIGFCFFVL